MGNCTSTSEPTSTTSRMEIPIVSQTTTIPTGQNKPLIPFQQLSKWSSNPAITLSQLEFKRREFWDTQPTYSGSTEIWGILQQITTFYESDLKGMQELFDGMKLSCPTGDLRDGIYDSQGNLYIIPAFCLSEPINLLKDTINDGDVIGISSENLNDVNVKGKVEGKSILDNISSSTIPPFHLNIIIRMQSGQDFRYKCPSEITLLQLRLLCLETNPYGTNPSLEGVEGYQKAMKLFNVRLFYLGKLLDSKDDLKKVKEVIVPVQGKWEGSVTIQCMITPRSSP